MLAYHSMPLREQRISAVKRRNAWRRAIRQIGVVFVSFGIGGFAFSIYTGRAEVLQVLLLAIVLNVAGLMAINYSIETEEEETHADLTEQSSAESFDYIDEAEQSELPQQASGRERLRCIVPGLKAAVGKARVEWRRRCAPKIPRLGRTDDD